MSDAGAVRDRLLQAGLQLSSQRPRDEVTIALLGAVGWLERLLLEHRGAARAAFEAARDGTVDAALWLSAGRPREEVAGALLLATQALGGRGAAEPPARLSSEVWNDRRSIWQMIGGASPRTHLLDHMLSHMEEPGPGVLERVSEVLRYDADARVPEDAERVGLPLELVVRNARETAVISAADFRRIEPSVRWVSGPSGMMGIVGGRPFRVNGPLIYGSRAVRFHWLHEEALVPFGELTLRAAAGPA